MRVTDLGMRSMAEAQGSLLLTDSAYNSPDHLKRRARAVLYRATIVVGSDIGQVLD